MGHFKSRALAFFSLYNIVTFLNILFLFAVFFDVVVPFSRPLQSLFVVVMNISYLIVTSRSNKRDHIRKVFSPYMLCILIYLLLIVVQIVICMFQTNGDTMFFSLAILLINFTFFFILSNKYNQIQTISSIIAPYKFIGIYTATASVFVFILLTFGIIDIYSFQLDPYDFDMFERNAADQKFDLFYPLWLTFVTSIDRGVPFFGEFGSFTGLCHEPHISTLLATPALFFTLANLRKHSMLLSLAFVFYSLIATSVTNIILLPLCVIIYYFLVGSSRIAKATIIVVGVLLLLSYELLIDLFGLQIVLLKFEVGNTSQATTSDLLTYMYSPQSFWGTGVMVNYVNSHSTDIGFISFLLIVIYQVSFYYGLIRLFLQKNIYSIYAIGILYFALHSIKLGQMAFQYPYLLFVLFVSHIIYVESQKKTKINSEIV